MNEKLSTVRQEELVIALRQEPLKGTISVKQYLKQLENQHQLFQKELERNVKTAVSAKTMLEFLTVSLIDVQNAYMFFEGSFEILLFPSDELQIDNHKINTYNKAHILIFKMTINSIQHTIEFVKYAQEHNLFDTIKIEASRYIVNSRKFKIIDAVELGFSIFNAHICFQRNGESMILADFIVQLGKFLGIEILNPHQRIIELQNRKKKTPQFLNRLQLAYSANIKKG